jgi:hypothetical protein
MGVNVRQLLLTASLVACLAMVIVATASVGQVRAIAPG